MSLDEQVRDLKDRHTTAMRARVRAEHERDAAKARLDDITGQLQRDFGVTDAAGAKQLLDELHTQLRDAITDVGIALDQAGAS